MAGAMAMAMAMTVTVTVTATTGSVSLSHPKINIKIFAGLHGKPESFLIHRETPLCRQQSNPRSQRKPRVEVQTQNSRRGPGVIAGC